MLFAYFFVGLAIPLEAKEIVTEKGSYEDAVPKCNLLYLIYCLLSPWLISVELNKMRYVQWVIDMGGIFTTEDHLRPSCTLLLLPYLFLNPMSFLSDMIRFIGILPSFFDNIFILLYQILVRILWNNLLITFKYLGRFRYLTKLDNFRLDWWSSLYRYIVFQIFSNLHFIRFIQII